MIAMRKCQEKRIGWFSNCAENVTFNIDDYLFEEKTAKFDYKKQLGTRLLKSLFSNNKKHLKNYPYPRNKFKDIQLNWFRREMTVVSSGFCAARKYLKY